MDRRATLILERARQLHRGSSFAALPWNTPASAQQEAGSWQASSLTSEQRAYFLKNAESALLEEGIITQIDQS
ncbi:MAG: hypothetical protein AB7F76_06845 [Parvibaculaceae bacterium]|jgi:hypothetical protein